MSYEQQFLRALALTLVFEIGVALLLRAAVVRWQAKAGPLSWLAPLGEVSVSRLVIAGLLASSLTLPYLWFVLPVLPLSRFLYLLVGECSVTAVEALLYRHLLPLKLRTAFLLSLLCNACSFLLGVLLQPYL